MNLIFALCMVCLYKLVCLIEQSSDNQPVFAHQQAYLAWNSLLKFRNPVQT